MPNISIHLVPFLEIVAVIAAAPALGFYLWRGMRRRARERAAYRAELAPSANPVEVSTLERAPVGRSPRRPDG